MLNLCKSLRRSLEKRVRKNMDHNVKAKVTAKAVMPKGIIIFSVLIIFYALLGFPLSDFKAYYPKFYPSAQYLIFGRYVLSIAIRIILIVTGLGILFRKEIFRDLILALSFFTIATVYWKHPLVVFQRIFSLKVAQGALPSVIIPKINMLSWACVILNSLVDIGFSLCLIYYFTRPKVREQFSD